LEPLRYFAVTHGFDLVMDEHPMAASLMRRDPELAIFPELPHQSSQP